jgi:hypothetical protein
MFWWTMSGPSELTSGVTIVAIQDVRNSDFKVYFFHKWALKEWFLSPNFPICHEVERLQFQSDKR